jgi:hypothetical protein
MLSKIFTFSAERFERTERDHASDESTIARDYFPSTHSTLVRPSRLGNWSAGTLMGPREGAVPGQGCGNAVELAV